MAKNKWKRTAMVIFQVAIRRGRGTFGNTAFEFNEDVEPASHRSHAVASATWTIFVPAMVSCQPVNNMRAPMYGPVWRPDRTSPLANPGLTGYCPTKITSLRPVRAFPTDLPAPLAIARYKLPHRAPIPFENQNT